MKTLIAALVALALTATSAAALPRFACQKAGEIAHTAMAYRQAGYSSEAIWDALQPEIDAAVLQARMLGLSQATVDRYVRLAHDQLLPILFNIQIQRTQKARDRMSKTAGELAYARCMAL